MPWALFVSGAVPNVLGLQGKRLTYANASSRDLAFIEHALLESELNVAKFFGQKQGAPDIASAVASVTLGKADAVLAPLESRQGAQEALRRRHRADARLRGGQEQPARVCSGVSG